MADVELKIGGDIDDLEKGIKKADKLLAKQDKRLSRKRARNRLKQTRAERKKQQKITLDEIREQTTRERMDKRLSKRRARNKLRIMRQTTREEIRELKKRDREERRLLRKRARARLKQTRIRIREEKKLERQSQRDKDKRQKRVRGGVRGAGRGVGRGIGGLGSVASLQFDLVGAFQDVINFERDLVRFASEAEISNSQMMGLKDSIEEVSVATGVSRGILLESAKAAFDAGGGFDLATDSVLLMGKAIAGLDVDATDFGKILASIKSGFKTTNKEAGDFVSILLAQAKAGTINIGDLASIGPEAFGAAKGAGFGGRRGASLTGALLQLAGFELSPSEAKTAVKNLFTGFITRRKGFAKHGVDVTDDQGSLRDPALILKEIVRATGGDITKLSPLFGEVDRAIINELASEFRETKGFGTFDRFVAAGLGAQGLIQKRFDPVAQTGAFKLDQLGSLIALLTDKAFLTGVNTVITSLTDFIKNEGAVKELISDFEQVGDAIVSLSELINALTPSFKLIKGLAVGLDESEIKGLESERASRETFQGPLGQFFKGNTTATRTGGSLLSGSGDVTVETNINVIDGKVSGQSAVTQNNPSTGQTKRTFVPIGVRGAR